MDKQLFINKVKDGAVGTAIKHGILASLTIAQAALESDWGESELTRAANNLFGIKRWGYPDFIELPTTEYISGKPVTEKSEFRKYTSWDYSIADHTAFLLQNGRYMNLIGLKDYKQVCTLIQQDGYATDPKYAGSLIQIIEDNNLQKFDALSIPNPVITSIQELCNSLGLKGKNENELATDGILGPNTVNAISKQPVIQRGSKGAYVKWVQQRLITLGFNCGVKGSDGVFGYCTLAAVQNFQAKHGLKPDGKIGLLTLDALLK